MRSKALLYTDGVSVYYVYMLLLHNGSIYTGYTVDIPARMRKHAAGKGSKCVRAFKAKKLLRVWKTDSRSGAMRLEARIKQLDRENKHSLADRPVRIRAYASDLGSVRLMRKYSLKCIEYFTGV